MNFSCIYHRAVMFKTVRTLLLLLLLLTVSGLSAQVTITRTSSDIFYIGNAPISCNYVGYSVTNNSGGDYDTVSVTVGDFVGTGSVVGLAINEDGSINLGSIADGESKMAYFYLKATGETTNTQTHTISVFDEFGGAGNLLVDVDFDLTVENTIQANANKVTATLIGPDPAGLGGIATIEFTGETGTIGAAKILSFSPATYDNWRADVLQMLSAEIVLSGANTATITDKLFIPTSDVLNTSNTNYVATYTFRVTNETPVDTVLSPLAFISSGTQVKHTSVSSIEALFLPPISNSLVLAKSASPAGLGIGGGQVTYTVTVTNSGIDDTEFPGQNNAILDRFVDLLPVSPAVATYVASSATYNGVSIADPTIDTDGGTGQQTLTWTGSFVVPASSSVDLTYTVAIPATVGTYGNQVIAYIEDTVIDTTTPTDDNVPAVASVTVSANTPPELDNALIDQEAVYGASQTYSFAADSFSDNEDTSLDYTTSVLPSGITFDPSTRTFNVNGTVGVDVYAVTVTATDDDGAEVSDIFNITITQAPLLVSANDVSIANGDAIPSPLSATITGYVNGENFGSSDLSGSASVTTSATQGAGIGDYAIIAADGTLDSTNYSFSFAAGNLEMTNNAPELNPAAPDAPSGGGIPGQTEVYGTDLNYSFPVNTFTDVEDGTTLTYTATGVPAGVTFTPGTRTFSGQPDGGVDTYTVTVRATDSNGGFVETEFDITITQAPLLVSANDVSIANGDAIPSPLSATITGYVNGENFGSSDLSGSASVTTSATQGAGIGDYAIIAADGTLDSTNYSFSFAAGNLEMTNNAPELNPAAPDAPSGGGIPGQTEVYGTDLNYSFPVNTFTDVEDGTTLTYTATGVPAGVTFTPGTRTFSGQPDGGVDTYTVTVRATDSNGGFVETEFDITITQAPLLVSANDVSIANGDAIPSPLSATITGYVNGENFGSSDLSGSASVTTSATQGAGIGDYAIIAADGTLDSTNYSFSFAAGNLEMTNNAPELNPAAPDAPSGGGIPGQTEVYGTDLNYSFPVNTFTDVEDGTTLTYTATGVPAGVTFTPGTRTFSGQPDGGVDTYTVTVRATDSNGGFVETEFDITITQAPLLVSANDVSIANGDAIPSPLSATITGYVNGENFGSSDLSGSASVTTSATQGAGIGDYAIIAADGTLDSTNYSFSFAAGNLEMTNNAPTAPQVSNFNEADGDTPTEINVSFTDADGDDLTYSAIGLPAGITIGLNSGLINGTLGNLASAGGPLSDGVYNVIVTANDTTDTTAYPFTYTVNNPAPVAQDDGTYDVHTATLLTGNNVGDNDSDGGNDSDTLSYAILGNASNGTAAVNPDGGFTYTSNGSYAGADSFTYTVTDQQGATDTATVNINVTNDAPEIDPEVFTAKISGEFADIDVISIDASFSDDDGDTLTYSATGLPEGLSIDSDTGEITGELAHLASAGGPQNDGVYTVTVTADDGVTTTDVEFELVVLNPVPVAVDDDFEMLSSDDPSLADTVATNDSDPDGDTPFSFGISTDVSGGDLTLNPDGSFIYTPAADFYGEDSFTYTVSDSQGATSETATVTIDVVGVGGILIEPLETPELNWQTALYEQTVRVTNLHIRSIIGFRMIVNGLAQDILLFNPSGTLEDETPYIEYAQTLAAVGEDGNSVELVVELKRDSLAPFETPDYVVIEVLTSEVETATVSESGANVTSTALLADGAFIIEFNTIIGNVYAIEYSEDLENWKRVLPLYTANVEKTQWIDNGPPKTIIHPNAVDGRFYRIVTIAE